MSATLTGTRVLNCLVTGQVRSGSAVIQTSLHSHPNAVCHGDILHDDSATRQSLYEAYFGRAAGRTPSWFAPRENDLSPEMFLTTRIFDHPLYGEHVVGARVLYQQLREHDLWEYLRERCLEGDFCVIHIMRNPVACYISMKQAQQIGVWYQDINDRTVLTSPASVFVDMKDLVKFCRNHLAAEQKLRAMCDDRLEIEYRELFASYPQVMRSVFKYLGLSVMPEVRPGVRRLKNRGMRERICDFDGVREAAPADIRPYFDENLF